MTPAHNATRRQKPKTRKLATRLPSLFVIMLSLPLYFWCLTRNSPAFSSGGPTHRGPHRWRRLGVRVRNGLATGVGGLARVPVAREQGLVRILHLAGSVKAKSRASPPFRPRQDKVRQDDAVGAVA